MLISRRLALAAAVTMAPLLLGQAASLKAAPSQKGQRSFSISKLLEGPRRKVLAERSSEGGESLRVTLQPGLAESEMYDKPTFVQVPASFSNGVIEVDLMARILPDAPELARGFVGLAYRINPAADRFEAVYLRPTNGRGLKPPAPRDSRAVQWFAFPDWPFSRLRKEHPSGPYEAGADVAPDRWMRLKLDIRGKHVVAYLDGRPVLDVKSLAVPTSGAIGLWVDIGTEGFFRNLQVTHAD